MHRFDREQNSALTSLVGLALVVVATGLAYWWWSHGAWGDFSAVNSVLPYVTYSRDAAQAVEVSADVRTPASDAVDARTAAQSPVTPPHCPPGEYAELRARVC